MHVAVRGRQFLARHPLVYWAAVLLVAALAGATVHTRLSALDAERDRWAATTTVWVATRDHAAGDRPDVRHATLPLAAVPPSAVGSLRPDTRLRQRLAEGEVVVEADLVELDGPAARADPRSVVVGLTDPLSRNVQIGLRVQVVADGIVLAHEATVVDVVDDIVFVATGAREAPAIASAARSGVASLVYLP
jgi:hypothetical protein